MAFNVGSTNFYKYFFYCTRNCNLLTYGLLVNRKIYLKSKCKLHTTILKYFLNS